MYRYRGIKISGERITPVGSREGENLLILAGSKSVWSDYIQARTFFSHYNIMCVNDIAGVFKAEPIQHIVSLHAELCEPLRVLRKHKGMLEHVITHSYKHKPGVQVCWDGVQVGSESGNLAVRIALLMGYERIILCGISLDNQGHFFDPEDPTINSTSVFNRREDARSWTKLAEKPELKDRIRAISGALSNIYGKPTEEWSK
jgi:hypothetical protein